MARISRVRAYLNKGDKAMDSMMKHIVVSAVLVLGTGAAVATAADNPFIGTWKENIASSTATSTDPWPKSVTRIFIESDQGVALTTKTTAADGKKSTSVDPPVKWDGLPHPVTNDPAVDTISVKQLGDRMAEYAFMKAGKTVQSGTVEVSNDGKTMTITGKATTPKGVDYYNLVHYLVQSKK
jgi:uncharacterized Zn-binding protein involved in type VI secretion